MLVTENYNQDFGFKFTISRSDMDAYTLFTFIIVLSVVSAGVIGPSAAVLQGPSRKTTLIGPEGSVISSIAPGGQVITEEHPAVVAHTAPAKQIIAAVLVEPAVSAVPAHPGVPLVAAPLVHGIGHGVGGALYDDGSYKPHLY